MKQNLSTEEKLAQKRERIPVHEHGREILTTKGLDKENFHYRFVNVNHSYRVQVLLDAGYQFVSKGGALVGDVTVDTVKGTDSLVTKPGGKGIDLYLMALPMELYQQDQAAKEAKIRETEEVMEEKLASQANPRTGRFGWFRSQQGANPSKKV
jgi:hypothetical protein